VSEIEDLQYKLATMAALRHLSKVPQASTASTGVSAFRTPIKLKSMTEK
jgi:hypothetical protein